MRWNHTADAVKQRVCVCAGEGYCWRPVPASQPKTAMAGHPYMLLLIGVRPRVVRSWHRILPASKQSTLLYVPAGLLLLHTVATVLWFQFYQLAFLCMESRAVIVLIHLLMALCGSESC